MVIILSLPDSSYFNREKTEFEARCVVLETDDAYVFQRGIFKQGEQRVKVRLTTGEDKGQVLDSVNLLQGAVELEWFYKKRDDCFSRGHIRLSDIMDRSSCFFKTTEY